MVANSRRRPRRDARYFNAAHTSNISFAGEIGHFEYGAAVRNDANATCDKSWGDDINNPDNSGPDPSGDDVFCLPGSARHMRMLEAFDLTAHDQRHDDAAARARNNPGDCVVR